MRSPATPDPTTLATTERRVRDAFRRLMQERDFSCADEFWSASSVVHHVPLDLSCRGRDAIQRFFEDLFAAVPDWWIEIERVAAAPGHAVVQWRASGTHTGAVWQGIEPAGRHFRLRGCDVIRFAADGRVAETTVYYDGAALARQLGQLP